MDWFRHYHGCAFDPKWRTVARRARSSIAVVVFVWDTLMEAASQDNDRGSVASWNAEVIADHLMCDVDEVARVRVEIEQVGVIADNRLTAWDKRQPADPTAAERMKRYRARQKANETVQEPEPANGDDPLQRNDRNADDEDRNSLHQNREEQNREEQNREDGAPAGAYRWEGKVVRLNEGDFTRWGETFHALDLPAQLLTIDGWLATEAKPHQRKNWFNLVAGTLRKRHEAALAERRIPQRPKTPAGYGFDVA